LPLSSIVTITATRGFLHSVKAPRPETGALPAPGKLQRHGLVLCRSSTGRCSHGESAIHARRQFHLKRRHGAAQLQLATQWRLLNEMLPDRLHRTHELKLELLLLLLLLLVL
jgi:hypothetical protein